MTESGRGRRSSTANPAEGRVDRAKIEESATRDEPSLEDALNTLPPQFRSALKRNAVSFEQWAESYFYRQPEFNPDSRSRAAYGRCHEELFKAFEAAHGHVEKSYFCSNVVAAVVLTSSDELHVVSNVRASGELMAVLNDCDSLRIEATRLLRDQDLRTCLEELYAVIASVLGLLDSLASSSSDGGRSEAALGSHLTSLQAGVRAVNDYYAHSAQRSAQIDYFLGMAIGLAALSLAVLILAIAISHVAIADLSVQTMLASLIAGAAGAVVSVLSRISAKQLQLDYEAGRVLLQLLGAFRPFIGAIIGTAVYFVVASGLLPIARPSSNTNQLYFYAGLAFISGFSERWAQDMLAGVVPKVPGRQSEQVTDQDGETKSEGST